ncbi:MAG: hypothetical protein HY788_06445 [Deltaproteobacteria bacterium]|nr:hypothetical protein [Deltaproteobacteria bacterium]
MNAPVFVKYILCILKQTIVIDINIGVPYGGFIPDHTADRRKPRSFIRRIIFII